MTVKIIAETGQSVVVEYQQDGARRVVVPRGAVHGTTIADGDLAAGIPYGVPWEEHVSPELAAELRRVGIWTARDLAERPQVAAAAIQRVMGVHLAALRRAAASYEGGSHE